MILRTKTFGSPKDLSSTHSHVRAKIRSHALTGHSESVADLKCSEPPGAYCASLDRNTLSILSRCQTTEDLASHDSNCVDKVNGSSRHADTAIVDCGERETSLTVIHHSPRTHRHLCETTYHTHFSRCIVVCTLH